MRVATERAERAERIDGYSLVGLQLADCSALAGLIFRTCIAIHHQLFLVAASLGADFFFFQIKRRSTRSILAYHPRRG